MTTINATKRTENGRKACKALRKQGQVPAILYGSKKESVPLSLPIGEAMNLHASAAEMKLNLGDAEEIVVVREIQRDAMDEKILHVDFLRVN